MSTINKTSQFWLGDDIDNRYYDPLTGEYNKPSGKDLFALSGYRKAIGNFVSIVTGQSIPVTFKGNDSYTDGKEVVLSSNISDGNFDVAVGLALHEGSHIKLTDFTPLQAGIHNYIPQELKNKAGKKGVEVKRLVKDLLNVVEDRRIDKFIQTEAPGYRGYYEAMYDYYFNAAIIDKALRTQQWCNKTLDDYMAHIINFINPNRTLDLLPGLRTIWNILDLRNISRLKSTDDALKVALEMAEELLKHIPDAKPEDEEQEDDQKQKGGEEGKEPTLAEKIANKLEILHDIYSKMEPGSELAPKVAEQIVYYEDLKDNL
jgi:hypothetical protein